MSGGTWDQWKRRRGYNPYGGTTQGAFTVQVVMDPSAKTRLQAGIIHGLEQCAAELRMTWAANLPGSLAGSMQMAMAPPEDGASVFSTDYRARFFEMGAKKHTITPKAGRHAAREAKQAYQLGLRGKARKELRQRALGEAYAFGASPVLRFQIGYGGGAGVYAAKVHHPGMRKTEPGRKALRETLPKMPSIMATAIERAL